MAFFFVPLVSLILSGLPVEPCQRPPACLISRGGQRWHLPGDDAMGPPFDLASRAVDRIRQQLKYRSPRLCYVQKLEAGGLSLRQAGALINRNIDVEAQLLAANNLFWASSILFLIMIGIVCWRGPRREAYRPLQQEVPISL